MRDPDSIVMLNPFQHPSLLLAPMVRVEAWTLKQVQGDGMAGGGTPSGSST